MHTNWKIKIYFVVVLKSTLRTYPQKIDYVSFRNGNTLLDTPLATLLLRADMTVFFSKPI